jgi:2-dehydro-3-deoxygluconokinase
VSTPPVLFAAIGECMLELRRAADGGYRLGYGGDTLNTAVYVARHAAEAGIAVDYVTALGDDPMSERMLEGWRAEGIGVGLIPRLPGRLPGLYAIDTDAHGQPRFYYWRSAAAARDMLHGGHVRGLLEKLADYDYLYLTGITLSILDEASRRLLVDLMDNLRARGGKVAFDSNYRPAGWPDASAARAAIEPVLRRADIALPTFGDERALFGDADPATTVTRLAALGIDEVCCKNDAEGCLLLAGGVTMSIPCPERVTPVDATAAGDAFNAGYLVARIAGATPETAARHAHLLAAAVIRHPGAIIPREAMPALFRI